MHPSFLLLSLTALITAPGAGDPTQPATDDKAATAQEVKRPKYALLPQGEDWSVLRGVDLSATDDFWDRIKYIELDERGAKWLSVGGHAWFRSETWNNFNFDRGPAADPSSTPNYDDTFVLSRVLLHADMHFGESLRVFVEGKTAQSTERDLPGGDRTLDVDTLALQQGFVDWNLIGEDSKSTLRAGRMMLQFGNQRLVSPLPWGNTLRSWEGVNAIHTSGDWTFTGLFTRFVPVDRYGSNQGDDDHLLYGVYGTHKSGKGGQDLYWLGVANADASFNGTTGDEFRQTVGGRWWGPLDARSSTFEVEGAGQFGQVGDEDVLAWMIASKFTTPMGGADSSLRGKLGLDWASGDDGVGGDVGTFNQLYPLGHAYYGYIDEVARQNAIDLWTGLDWSPTKSVTVSTDWHFFWLADENDALYNAGGGVVVPGGAATSSEVGNEFDLLVNWHIDRHATAILGYSHFFAGDVLSESPGADSDIDFFYFGLQYFF